MSVLSKGLFTIISCACVFAMLAIPLILRRIPRNIIYGFRTRATLGDDFLWYEANAHLGRGLLIASFISAGAGFILYQTQYLSPAAFLKASVIVLVAPPVVAALVTARHVRSLTPGGSIHRHGR
jgi:hypothetical protein